MNYINEVFEEKKIASKTLSKIRNDIVKNAVLRTGNKFTKTDTNLGTGTSYRELQEWVFLHYPKTLQYETDKRVRTPCTLFLPVAYLPHPLHVSNCMWVATSTHTHKSIMKGDNHIVTCTITRIRSCYWCNQYSHTKSKISFGKNIILCVDAGNGNSLRKIPGFLYGIPGKKVRGHGTTDQPALASTH